MSKEDKLVPVKLDKNSNEIHYVSKSELANIIESEANRYLENFDSMSETDKETFLASIIRDLYSEHSELKQCLSTTFIFKFCKLLRLSDGVSKTIADWMSYFLVGTMDISFTFIRTTILFFMNNYIIILLLCGLYIVGEYLIMPHKKKLNFLQLDKQANMYNLDIENPENLKKFKGLNQFYDKAFLYKYLHTVEGDINLYGSILNVIQLNWVIKHLYSVLGEYTPNAQILTAGALYIKDLIYAFKDMEKTCSTDVGIPIDEEKIKHEIDIAMRKLKKNELIKKATKMIESEVKEQKDFDKEYKETVSTAIVATPKEIIIQKPSYFNAQPISPQQPQLQQPQLQPPQLPQIQQQNFGIDQHEKQPLLPEKNDLEDMYIEPLKEDTYTNKEPFVSEDPTPEEYIASIYRASIILHEESLKPQSDTVKNTSAKLKSLFQSSIVV